MKIIRLVALSDSHNRHGAIKVPDGDILIHAGDATLFGELEAVSAFLTWMGELPHQHKIFIAGNHDKLFEQDSGIAKQLCRDNDIIYLEDSGVELMGIKFWGSPVTPWFHGENWVFNRARNSAEEAYYRARPIQPHWDAIPNDTDVLITHGPPYKILDEELMVNGDSYPYPRYVGCVALKEAIDRIKPDIHIFGHIHSFGQKHQDGVSYYNVAVVDCMHSPTSGCTQINYIQEDV